ncbi:MAG TPA: DUF5333 domain-containing protein [Paracoccus sp. (in: a-proteobacteria)]|nr:DUF5333 domain-containing protein [Paracoccus sp. (in: a-proteobacteria)]
MKRLIAAALIAVLPGVASAAPSLPPLAQEKYINDRLIAARIADRIRRECPTLDARIIYAFRQARALERYALDKGYSKDQVEAFLDSKPDRARIYAVAEDYLTRNGARKGDPESFCRIGRAEMEQGSVTGSLLVAK